MQTDCKYIKKQFEKSMGKYDKNAVVQKVMAEKIVAEILKVSDNFENIVELGSGTGLLSCQISKSIKFKNYYANDLVEKSKNYVQKFIPKVNFLYGNALKINPPKKADLIISNAMFQWFENLNKAIEIIKLSMNKNSILAFSTFAPDNFKEITDITGLSLSYKNVDEIKKIIENNGFKILYCENFTKKLNFKTPLELLAHMKNTGVNSLSEKTWTVKKVKEFCDKYSQKYPQPELTYSPIIIIAEKIN